MLKDPSKPAGSRSVINGSQYKYWDEEEMAPRDELQLHKQSLVEFGEQTLIDKWFTNVNHEPFGKYAILTIV